MQNLKIFKSKNKLKSKLPKNKRKQRIKLILKMKWQNLTKNLNEFKKEENPEK